MQEIIIDKYSSKSKELDINLQILRKGLYEKDNIIVSNITISDTQLNFFLNHELNNKKHASIGIPEIPLETLSSYMRLRPIQRRQVSQAIHKRLAAIENVKVDEFLLRVAQYIACACSKKYRKKFNGGYQLRRSKTGNSPKKDGASPKRKSFFLPEISEQPTKEGFTKMRGLMKEYDEKNKESIQRNYKGQFKQLRQKIEDLCIEFNTSKNKSKMEIITEKGSNLHLSFIESGDTISEMSPISKINCRISCGESPRKIFQREKSESSASEMSPISKFNTSNTKNLQSLPIKSLKKHLSKDNTPINTQHKDKLLTSNCFESIALKVRNLSPNRENLDNYKKEKPFVSQQKITLDHPQNHFSQMLKKELKSSIGKSGIFTERNLHSNNFDQLKDSEMKAIKINLDTNYNENNDSKVGHKSAYSQIIQVSDRSPHNLVSNSHQDSLKFTNLKENSHKKDVLYMSMTDRIKKSSISLSRIRKSDKSPKEKICINQTENKDLNVKTSSMGISSFSPKKNYLYYKDMTNTIKISQSSLRNQNNEDPEDRFKTEEKLSNNTNRNKDSFSFPRFHTISEERKQDTNNNESSLENKNILMQNLSLGSLEFFRSPEPSNKSNCINSDFSISNRISSKNSTNYKHLKTLFDSKNNVKNEMQRPAIIYPMTSTKYSANKIKSFNRDRHAHNYSPNQNYNLFCNQIKYNPHKQTVKLPFFYLSRPPDSDKKKGLKEESLKYEKKPAIPVGPSFLIKNVCIDPIHNYKNLSSVIDKVYIESNKKKDSVKPVKQETLQKMHKDYRDSI